MSVLKCLTQSSFTYNIHNRKYILLQWPYCTVLDMLLLLVSWGLCVSTGNSCLRGQTLCVSHLPEVVCQGCHPKAPPPGTFPTVRVSHLHPFLHPTGGSGRALAGAQWGWFTNALSSVWDDHQTQTQPPSTHQSQASRLLQAIINQERINLLRMPMGWRSNF